MNYPSKVQECDYGKCLVAGCDLEPGTVVQKFEGQWVTDENIPESDVCYALWVEENKWLLPRSDARFMNHSCEPNCIITDDLDVVTVKSIKQGEQLTFSYNVVKSSENPGQWNPRWSFKCECGSLNCQGKVDKYVEENGRPWVPE